MGDLEIFRLLNRGVHINAATIRDMVCELMLRSILTTLQCHLTCKKSTHLGHCMFLLKYKCPFWIKVNAAALSPYKNGPTY